MQKKSIAIILIACLLLLSVLSTAPLMGKVFIAVAWYANSGDRNADAAFGVAGLITGSGYGALASIAGASLAASTGIGLAVGA